ncbi:multidrug efflux system, subunit A [Legionella quinlivanii]|uniref:Multidrug efflux system, subunit A n=1 Tax=Legionella quinlivanii TaxID=45073 RepID=A0A0W0Y807_9GAMM|nr:efflux RND transporter periplasmic adaptor subunit [Legionella quinlivanii]KTD53067.1 multidrug efflux system, subunit A [Legionella quinlivanii]SEG16665.1 membrane fusion protein, multidrug efflux system [Legionella quinlivanii DSM 21216]STY10447.1 multidrug efflux system, subunit A [Legionella quinlivanii]
MKWASYHYLSSLLRQCLLLSPLLLITACGEKPAQQSWGEPEVGVVELQYQSFPITVELPGRVRAHRIAEVRPQVNGIILKRLFTEGSDVKEGQSLYQIDPAPYQAAVDTAKGELSKAEANLEIANLTVQRYKPLLGNKFVSKQDYDTAVANAKQAEASVESAKASLETAKINLQYTKVLSPIDGRIGRSSVTEGALVAANQQTAMAVIHQLNPIFVDITQSSNDFFKLQKELEKGKPEGKSQDISVQLFLDDGSLYDQKGKLEFSEVQVDETTGSITLRAIFPNPESKLLPGMFVRAQLNMGVNPKALLVPQQGITRDNTGKATALIVDGENKVEQRNITVTQAVKDKWLVTKGLSAGDKIIVSGQLKVKPGSKVKILKLDEKKPEKTKVDG